ncbi:MAG: hypothetical protein AKCLJLPJ_01899 [Fimbriimonadales bacterium]|nr:hypothetical protein [Fimbriimonadales bacterium]
MSKINYNKHKDKRVNNPTMEKRNFFVEEEHAPYPMLYPRDPSLDPQLVWKGKDDQDREDLAVPTVPIYKQEHIHPKAIIEDLQRNGEREKKQEQPALFADFNGMEAEDDLDKFQKSTEFYQHENNWSNRMILGDSLLVMNSLAEKEGLKGKVQCIYLDPPYGIKFGSNWQTSTRKRDVKDGKAEDAAREPEVIRAFRDTWEKGIHSYLSYLRDRFVVACELLSETGSIFVQIGDENVHLVRCVLDEVLGSENFCAEITFYKTTSQTSALVSSTVDYVLWYAKNKGSVKYRSIFREKSIESDKAGVYNWIELPDGTRRRMTQSEKSGDELIPAGARIFRLDNMTSQSGGDTTAFQVEMDGKVLTPGKGFWKTNEAGMKRLMFANRVVPSGSTLAYVRKLDDFAVYPFSNLWTDTGTGSFTDEKVYVVQTGTKVIERCILMTTDPGDLVLDPTCGSGTTAFVAEQWGRRWITIDTSRVALALARTRLMSAKFPYYLLADSEEGLKKEAEITGHRPLTTGHRPLATGHDIRKGFVYKRVPHVTLKSIANNPDVKEGMSREEIDAAIARHADTEMLYDQPYQDNKRIRVTGPFTVESLSPHRVLPADEDRPESETEARRDDSAADFANMAIENLRKAGVQNGRKKEHLKFLSLHPHAGRWIHATGEFAAEGDDKPRRVAVSIGPEYGAVSPMQIKEAAKEAVEGIGYDLLVVCGYAFDPHVAEETKKYGNLTVLPTRMNADLSMGDELLKKTGAGNLFMVFGEPDTDVRETPEGVVVELRGVDVFDPTTGEIRSSSTDDIACWFIDTNYNGEMFFVRHAYFTGGDEPYEKLRKALRAEVDEDAWASIYGTVSRPFQRPETGKFAVKVINHYGDEVLKVYDLGP